MSDSTLCFDFGAQTWRAALIDHLGRCQAQASRPAPSLQAEMPADTWWRGLQSLAQAILKEPNSTVKAVAITALSGCTQWLDRAGVPLRDCLTWRDIRAAEAANQLALSLGSAVPHHHAAARLAWLQQHKPEQAEQVAYVLDIKDDLNRRLSGVFSTDTVSAARQAVVGRSENEVFSHVGFDCAHLPLHHEPQTVVGHVQAGLPGALALLAGLPVINGSHDIWAASLGAGAVRAPQAFLLSDQGEYAAVLLRHSRKVTGLLSQSWHETTQLLSGPMQAGIDTLRWWAMLTQRNLDEPDALEDWLSKPLASSVPIFLPHLQGALSPHWLPQLTGVFAQLEPSHNPLALLHSIAQGMAFSNRQVFELMGIGDETPAIMIAGELAQSDTWCQLKADVLGRVVHRRAAQFAATLGASINAATALGVYPSLLMANAAQQGEITEFYPDYERRQQFDARYERFKQWQDQALRLQR